MRWSCTQYIPRLFFCAISELCCVPCRTTRYWGAPPTCCTPARQRSCCSSCCRASSSTCQMPCRCSQKEGAPHRRTIAVLHRTDGRCVTCYPGGASWVPSWGCLQCGAMQLHKGARQVANTAGRSNSKLRCDHGHVDIEQGDGAYL